MPDEANDQDPWTDEALLSTASAFPGVGSDAGLAEVDRFRAAISRLVAKTMRRGVGDSSEARVSIFLLEPQGPPDSIAAQCIRVPMLDRGREPLEGRVWFVTHVATVGTWVLAEFDTDDLLFRFVTDEVGCGDVPAIVFDPREPGPELRFYREGIGKPESHEPLQIANTRISLEEIFRRIDLVYQNQLVTPAVQPRRARLWADAMRGITSSNAEDLLSGLLAAALSASFSTCTVRVEQPQPTGRVDIEVEERISNSPGAVMRHAILELKVLRGRNPNGTAVSAKRLQDWIEDGVVQAAAYREDKGALASALCCFDMRSEFTDRQCFAHVIDLAQLTEVELRVWHLFASAKSLRSYQRKTGLLDKRAEGSSGSQP